MVIDYDKHPSFSIPNLPGAVLPEEFNRFNSFYKLLKTHGRTMSSSDIARIKEECCVLLRRIFTFTGGALKASSNRQEIFLTELHQHVLAMLNEDIKFFTWKMRNTLPQMSGSLDSIENAAKLNNDKFFTVNINLDVVREMLDISKNELDIFRKSAKLGKTNRENLSINEGGLILQLIKILNIELNNKGFNDAVSIYMGRSRKVNGLALELSVPEAVWWRNPYPELNQPPKTLYYHTDESLAHPKAIIYLCDVNEKNGPTSVVPNILDFFGLNPMQILIGRVICKVGRDNNSILSKVYRNKYHQVFGCEHLRADFMSLPSEMRWNSHFGSDVIPNSSIEEKLIFSEQIILGKMGTGIIFDGANLVHRGGLVLDGERIALQVIFGESNSSLINRSVNGVRKISKYILHH